MDSSKGIGTPNSATPPPKSEKTNSSGKSGQGTVRPAQKGNRIPHSHASGPTSGATPIKKRASDTFDKKYQDLADSKDVLAAEAIFQGMEKLNFSDKQMAKARNLMMTKSAILVAEKYLELQLDKYSRKTQVRKACSLENLQGVQVRLKTIAGRLARFISPESVHEQLASMLGPAPRVKLSSEPQEKIHYENIDFTPENATELVKTDAGLSDFLALNRRLSLFIMVINARIEAGIPLEDEVNQQLLKKHQQLAGDLIAKKFFEKQHYQSGSGKARETCLALLDMTDEDIFSQLEKNAMPQVKKVIELEPAAEQMPTYISMDNFRHKLASFFGMEEY